MKFALVVKLPVSEGDTVTNIMQARGPIQRYWFVFQPYPVNFADLHHFIFFIGRKKFCLHKYEGTADVKRELDLGFPETYQATSVLPINPTPRPNLGVS